MEKASGERGEHMSYPPKFEDIDAWQLAQELARRGYGLWRHQSSVIGEIVI